MQFSIIAIDFEMRVSFLLDHKINKGFSFD